MTARTPAPAPDQGIVQGVRGRRSWAILAGRFAADGLWILPAVWKPRLRAHSAPAARTLAFPTPLWTARAPPTGSTGVLILDLQTATRVGSRGLRNTEMEEN